MSNNLEQDQKLLRHLLFFLNQNQPQSVDDNGRLKSIWDPHTQSAGKLKIQSCLLEMLKPNPDSKRIAQELEPYKDDAIPVLIEAIDFEHTIMYFNAIHVLKIIGDYRVIPLIWKKFDKFIESSFTMDLLKKIASRENSKTRTLIIDRLIKYLTEVGETIPFKAGGLTDNRAHYDQPIQRVIDSLVELGGLSDPHLPSLLEKYITKFAYKSHTFQTALTVLSKVDAKKAALCLEVKMDTSEDYAFNRDNKQTRIATDERNEKTDESFLTICVREQNEPELKEIPYAFKYEKPLVYFLKNGQDTKILAGGAENKSEFPNTALKYLGKWLTEIDTPDTKYQECIKLLSENIDLSKWGFRQSYILPKKYPTIIYDSEWCRVKFSFDARGDFIHDNMLDLYVSYGRLHALYDKDFMVWNGEKCWCWHGIDYALNFLDGLSPEEAIKVEYRPRVKEQYRDSESSKTLTAAKLKLRLEAEIWKNYGQRLFELFDLRLPQLWDQFSHFMKKFQAIQNSNSYSYPSKEKIC